MTAQPPSSSSSSDVSSSKPAYYVDEINQCVTDYMRDLLVRYSRIPQSQLESHLYTIRDKVWAVAPYPCVGYFGFLLTNIRDVDGYDSILEKTKEGARVLDVGTCVGQELRALVNDGAPSENMYATDITTSYWPLGFELFNDRPTFQANYIQSDIFDPSSELATKLKSSCDVVYLGLILHLFSYDLQVEASCQIIELTKKGPGAIIAGKSGGWDKAGVQKRHLTIQNEGKNKTAERFRHDKESFRKMWNEVSEATGTKWNVQVRTEIDHLTWRHQMDDLAGRQPEWVYFTMTRLE